MEDEEYDNDIILDEMDDGEDGEDITDSIDCRKLGLSVHKIVIVEAPLK